MHRLTMLWMVLSFNHEARPSMNRDESGTRGGTGLEEGGLTRLAVRAVFGYGAIVGVAAAAGQAGKKFSSQLSGSEIKRRSKVKSEK